VSWCFVVILRGAGCDIARGLREGADRRRDPSSAALMGVPCPVLPPLEVRSLVTGPAGSRPPAAALFRPPTQKPHLFGVGFLFSAREPDDYLLSHGQSALSSAWSRFTVLFGMGRGGTDSLWSSGMTCCRVAFWGATTNLEEVVSDESTSGNAGCVVRGTTLISTGASPFAG
jgi:hypothetical protein